MNITIVIVFDSAYYSKTLHELRTIGLKFEQIVRLPHNEHHLKTEIKNLSASVAVLTANMIGRYIPEANVSAYVQD